jgi:hypothetical protein
MTQRQTTTTELEVTSKEGSNAKTFVISGDLPNLHDNPSKVHRLLDLLELPKGTEVKVITKATSVIVR